MELIVNDEQKKFQGYLELNIARNIGTVKNYQKQFRCIMNNVGMGVSSYLESLIEYEDSIERSFSKDSGYEARYGILIDVLLPKGEWGEPKLKKFIAKYVGYIIGEEKQLKYIAWLTRKKKRTWIKIFISDREFYPQTIVKTYSRNLYIDKETKKWCSVKSENAQLFATKGDMKLDRDGNQLFEKVLFKKRKSRRFIYKDSQKESWFNSFREFFIQACEYCNCKIQKSKYFTRMNLRKAINPEQRRVIVAVNRCMQFVQNKLNIEYQRSLIPIDYYDVERYGGSSGELVPGVHTKKWEKIFEKYRNIFKNGVFNENDVEIFLFGRCDNVEENSIKLQKVFTEELENIKSEFIEVKND